MPVCTDISADSVGAADANGSVYAGQRPYDAVGAEYCKTVGSAYVGSNPTPATTSENGPLAAETRPGGPFPSRHAMYQGVSPRVDAWQCARTYGGQRPGKTSGAYNRSLCRSTPVLSHYPGAGTARLTDDCRASRAGSVLRRPARAGRRAGLVRPAAGAGCRISPRHPIKAVAGTSDRARRRRDGRPARRRGARICVLSERPRRTAAGFPGAALLGLTIFNGGGYRVWSSGAWWLCRSA